GKLFSFVLSFLMLKTIDKLRDLGNGVVLEIGCSREIVHTLGLFSLDLKNVKFLLGILKLDSPPLLALILLLQRTEFLFKIGGFFASNIKTLFGGLIFLAFQSVNFNQELTMLALQHIDYL